MLPGEYRDGFCGVNSLRVPWWSFTRTRAMYAAEIHSLSMSRQGKGTVQGIAVAEITPDVTWRVKEVRKELDDSNVYMYGRIILHKLVPEWLSWG